MRCEDITLSDELVEYEQFSNEINSINNRLKSIPCDNSVNSLIEIREIVQRILHCFGGKIPTYEFTGEKLVVILQDGQLVTINNASQNISYQTFTLDDVNRDEIVEIKYPSSTSSIAFNAFDDMPNLTAIVGPTNGSLTKIQDDTFRNCQSLKYVSFNNQISSIGENAFQNCDSIEKIVLPHDLTTISNTAFEKFKLHQCEVLFSVDSVHMSNDEIHRINSQINYVYALFLNRYDNIELIDLGKTTYASKTRLSNARMLKATSEDGPYACQYDQLIKTDAYDILDFGSTCAVQYPVSLGNDVIGGSMQTTFNYALLYHDHKRCVLTHPGQKEQCTNIKMFDKDAQLCNANMSSGPRIAQYGASDPNFKAQLESMAKKWRNNLLENIRKGLCSL